MEYLKNAKKRIDEANVLIGRAIGLEKLSSIERDIILDKLAKAYETILTAKSYELEVTVKKEVQNNVEVAKTKVSDVEFSENIVKEKVPDEKIVKEKEPKTIVDDVKKIKSPTKPVIKEDVLEVSREIDENQNSEQQDKNQTEIIAEKYQGKQKFLNEIMGEQSAKVDMSTKLQNKPISDLAKAIGINDKFIFIKELFDGDSTKYSETISRLNSFSDLNDAIIFLQENFQWTEGSESAAKFIDLVRRKFI